ncbi:MULTISPECIES: LPS translocon maturation chaperone LptM [Acinetobacter]|uniref:LPS translocon maturation chaperone LptM n=1 Tax=Acinetobacter TaxID=469 RepID=UPI0015BB4708|nr:MULTISPECIES: lipoprotein [Acinetobacter]MDV2453877.1 lipoprotein [Acinetobacter towneri]NWK53091.1 lipoprotein [Acinetobacter sp. SwsAc5]
MRTVICCVSVVFTTVLLVGCGQSGALQLPNDPNYDKRAKYLLYPDHAPQSVKPSETASEQAAPVQQQFAAPATSTSTTP